LQSTADNGKTRLNHGGNPEKISRDLCQKASLQIGRVGPRFPVLPAFSSPVVTILHCGVERVSVGQFERKGGRLRLVAQAVQVLPAGTLGSNDSWVGRTCAAFEALRERSGKATSVMLVLPRHASLLKPLRIPRVGARKRARIVGFEAGQNIPGPISDVIWDTMGSGGDKKTQNLLLAAAKQEIVEPLCAAAQAMGLTPRRVVPAPLALLTSMRQLRPGGAPELLMHLESRELTLLQTSGDEFALRALTLPCDVAAAGDRAGAVALRLAHEATRTMLYFQRQCGLPQAQRGWLAGEGAVIAGVDRMLAQQLRVPVQQIDLAALANAERSAENSMPSAVVAEMSGAALMDFQSPRSWLNLLPAAQKTEQRRRGRKPWLAAAALLTLAAPAVALVHFRAVAQEAEFSLGTLEARLAPLRSREARIRTHLSRLEQLQPAIAAWQDVEERRTGWLQMLADLEQRMNRVEGVWLERMNVVAGEGAGVRLAVSGRMLDRSDDGAVKGSGVFKQMKAVMGAFAESPFVSAVEDQRFDLSDAGLPGFGCVLVVDAPAL
ncbi:MAG TPA: hypothetical protein VHN79_09050, partial [Lacunisphaera sp.]|nr:hypothetical protein [Lacunisphaera sp.]